MKKITLLLSLLLSLLLFNLCACEVSYGHNENSGRGALLHKYQNVSSYYHLDEHYYTLTYEDKEWQVDISKVYMIYRYDYYINGIYNELFDYQYDTFLIYYLKG